MKKIYKKLSIIFVMAFAIMIGCFSNVFAADGIQSVTINKKVLTFNHVYYADATNGDDIAGDGSETKPFKTFYKAYDICVSGDAVFLNPGTYSLTSRDSGGSRYSTVFLNKSDVSIIGTQAQTIFTDADSPKNTFNNFVCTQGKNINIYNIIFKPLNSGYFSVLGDGGATYDESRSTNYYNCVFDCTNAGSIDTLVYENGCTTNVYNCTFKTNAKKIYKNYGITNFINCALNTGELTVSHNFNSSAAYSATACLASYTLNDDYSISSGGWKNIGTGLNPDETKANIGVYGGDFEWGYIGNSVSVTGLTLNKTMDTLSVGQTDTLTATITPDNATNKTVTWTSSDPTIATVDSNGKVTAVKEGTVTITAITTDGSNLSASCTVNVTSQGTTPTNPTDNSGNAVLTITMTNGNVKLYTVPMSKINDFISWYDNRVSGSAGKAYYTFDKTDSSQTSFSKKTEYIIFDKISSYEVDEYTK